MTPILVTGGTGQLATALRAAGGDAVRVVGRPEMDFDRQETLDALFASPPALLVNAAAWTAVDAAEADPDSARRANADGPAHLAALCHRSGTRLIHISTDYVFDGAKGAPYVEDDRTNPTGVYGTTKLAGEIEVRKHCPDAVILRTSWVYAASGRNFVRTMLNAAARRTVLRVVADQRGSPTNADDLARIVLDVARAIRGGAAGGVFHASGSGETTWHGFAEAIFAAAASYGVPRPDVQAIPTDAWPTQARRPADSRLDCTKLRTHFGLTMPPWQQSLERTIRIICAPAMAG